MTPRGRRIYLGLLEAEAEGSPTQCGPSTGRPSDDGSQSQDTPGPADCFHETRNKRSPAPDQRTRGSHRARATKSDFARDNVTKKRGKKAGKNSRTQ